MKNQIIFLIGSIMIAPSVLLISSENVFSCVLAAFYTLLLVVTGCKYFRAFWRKFFIVCYSFDLFFKSKVKTEK